MHTLFSTFALVLALGLGGCGGNDEADDDGGQGVGASCPEGCAEDEFCLNGRCLPDESASADAMDAGGEVEPPMFAEVCQAWHMETADGTCENMTGTGPREVQSWTPGVSCRRICDEYGLSCLGGWSVYSRSGSRPRVLHDSCDERPGSTFEWQGGDATFYETQCDCEGEFERFDAPLDTFTTCTDFCEAEGMSCRKQAPWGEETGGVYILYGDVSAQEFQIEQCWDEAAPTSGALPLRRVTCACDRVNQ